MHFFNFSVVVANQRLQSMNISIDSIRESTLPRFFCSLCHSRLIIEKLSSPVSYSGVCVVSGSMGSGPGMASLAKTMINSFQYVDVTMCRTKTIYV